VVSEAAAPARALRFAAPGAVPLGLVFGTIGALATLAVGVLHLDRLPFTVCTFKLLSGWPCLTCGSTRALGRLFHLDLAGALASNPLAILVALAVVPWALADLALLPRGQAVRLSLPPGGARIARVAAVLALVLNWIYLVAAGL
jgi:hypothetical protein